MRIAVAIAFAAVLALPHASEAQTSLDGFGAFSTNQLTSIGESGVPVDFGGRVSFEFVPGVQAFGEFGRLGNVLPSVVALPLSFAPVDLRVSAFYGEGGIRLLAAPWSGVSPVRRRDRRRCALAVRPQWAGFEDRCDYADCAERVEFRRYTRPDVRRGRRSAVTPGTGAAGSGLSLQEDRLGQPRVLNPQRRPGSADAPSARLV